MCLGEAALAFGVVACVLVVDGRNDELHHVVFDCLVGKAMPVVASIAWAAPVKLGDIVYGEAVAGQGGRYKEGGVIEPSSEAVTNLSLTVSGGSLVPAVTARKLGRMPRMRLGCSST